MWDTATDRLPDDEILFIFGHESGHYVLNHIPQELSGMAAGLFFVFWACAGFAGRLARRFGVRWQLGDPYSGFIPLASRQGFVVLLFALSVAGFILQPAGNTFSRHFEHEADVYGQEAIHGLVADPQKTAVSAFNHLGEAWLEDPNPAPSSSFGSTTTPACKPAPTSPHTTTHGLTAGGEGSLTDRDPEGRPGDLCGYSAVVGSITVRMRETRLAGNPPCWACLRTASSSGAM